LHDDISQQMALLEIDLLSGSAEGDAEELAGEAFTRAQSIARSVHDLSHRLHPAKLRLIVLVSALRGLQCELSQPDTTISFTHGAAFLRAGDGDGCRLKGVPILHSAMFISLLTLTCSRASDVRQRRRAACGTRWSRVL
jgi:hypothetical protein